MKTLQRLKISNFLNTASREIEFNDKWDVILITGENAKGKTTIMRAIYLCLTGEDAFFGANKLDNVIKNWEHEMRVELELMRWNNNYKIIVNKKLQKSIKIEIFENWERMNTSELLSDAKIILSQLFWTQKNILNNYFFFSASDDDIVTATPSGRLEIITKSSKIFQEYEDISKQASVFEKELAEEETAKKSLLVDTENRIQENIDEYANEMALLTELTNIGLYNEESIKNHIQELEEKLKEEEVIFNKMLRWKQLKEEIDSTESINIKEINNKLKENEEKERENLEIDNQINVLREKINSDERDKAKFTTLLHEVEKKIIAFTGEIKTLRVNYVSDIVERYIDIEQLENNKLELENNTKLKQSVEDQGKALATEISLKEKEKEKIKETFEHNKICPVCHSELTTKALELYLKNIDQEILSLEENKAKLKEEYVEVANKIKELELFINNTEAFISNSKIDEKTKAIEEEKTILEKTKVAIEENIGTFNKSIAEKEEEVQALAKNKKVTLSLNAKNELNNSLKQFSNLQAKLDEFNELKEELKNVDKAAVLENVKSMRNNIQEIKLSSERVKNIASRMDKEKEKEKTIKSELEVIKKDRVQYANLVEFFGKNGIQKKQVEHVLQNVEIETNSIINRFFNNIAIKFWFDGKGISLDIVRQSIDSNGLINNVEDDIKNFSDAQQEVLRVIIKLSFSRSIQYLQWVPLNMIFFNETFGKLSEDKEIELKKILDFFWVENQVIFITHNKNITSYFEEDSIIKIQ